MSDHTAQYSDLKLYNQLSYLRSLFDGERALSKVKGEGPRSTFVFLAACRITHAHSPVNLLTILNANEAALADMRATVDRFMNMCGRRWVDMTDLFGFMKLS